MFTEMVSNADGSFSIQNPKLVRTYMYDDYYCTLQAFCFNNGLGMSYRVPSTFSYFCAGGYVSVVLYSEDTISGTIENAGACSDGSLIVLSDLWPTTMPGAVFKIHQVTGQDCTDMITVDMNSAAVKTSGVFCGGPTSFPHTVSTGSWSYGSDCQTQKVSLEFVYMHPDSNGKVSVWCDLGGDSGRSFEIPCNGMSCSGDVPSGSCSILWYDSLSLALQGSCGDITSGVVSTSGVIIVPSTSGVATGGSGTTGSHVSTTRVSQTILHSTAVSSSASRLRFWGL